MRQIESTQLAKYFSFRKEPTCGSRCKTIGHMVVEPKTSYPPCPEKHPEPYHNVAVSRSLEGVHLVYIVSGSGWYINDNGERFTVRAGSALPIFPDSPHAYAPDESTGWVEYWLGCDGSFPKWLLRENAFRFGQQPIPIGPDRELMNDFRQLCGTTQADRLGGLINRLLGRIVVLQNSRPRLFADATSGLIEKAMSYLESRIGSDMSQHELSDLTGLSYRRLSHLFKEATGMTPHQFFLDKQMKLAVKLLESGASVTDVAAQLGFDSPYYFSRLFRIKVGCAPSNFKSGK